MITNRSHWKLIFYYQKRIYEDQILIVVDVCLFYGLFAFGMRKDPEVIAEGNQVQSTCTKGNLPENKEQKYFTFYDRISDKFSIAISYDFSMVSLK